MIKYNCILVIFILSVSVGYTQNLVPNYFFESIDQCPDLVNYGSVDLCVTSWTDPTNGTSDYYNSCSLDPFWNIPSHNNGYGYQYPRSGVGMVGLIAYQGPGTYREYIHVQLIDSLKQDSCYYVEFYVNKMNKPRYAVNLGCFISDTTINSNSGPILLNYTPQIEQPNASLLTDTLNWIRINGVYKANGGEQFITIGNFSDNNTIDTLTVGDTGNNGAFYYIEDVTLKLVQNNVSAADAGVDQSINQGDSVQIGNNTLSDAVYSWYPSAGLNDTTLENPIAKPTVTTTYYCTKDVCNNQTTDSVTVSVLPNGISSYYNNENFNLYPNPNNGSFRVTHNLIGKNYVLEIIDLMGKVVHQEMLTTTKQEIKTKQLNTGFYFINFKSNLGELMYSTKMSVIH